MNHKKMCLLEENKPFFFVKQTSFPVTKCCFAAHPSPAVSVIARKLDPCGIFSMDVAMEDGEQQQQRRDERLTSWDLQFTSGELSYKFRLRVLKVLFFL